jgi:lipoprotein-anchoring transpeptidase ErfK/SrfK
MVIKSGKRAGVYPIAIGKPETPTPTGQFHLSHFESDPDLPGNVTGVRWMEFFRQKNRDGSTELYGIHGTNVPAKIGEAVSHGCIRMTNEDVIQVFRDAHPGELVEVQDAPLDRTHGW